MSETIAPSRLSIVLIASAVAAVLAGTMGLWAHYGTAIFFEVVRTGFIACFG